MAKPFLKSDIRISRFRLPNEDLRDSGSGCLIHHIPSKQSYLSELEGAPFTENKRVAIGELCAALNITVEAFEQQTTTKVFPNWGTVEMFKRAFTHNGTPIFTITVFHFDDEDDPSMSGWTWDVDFYDHPHQNDPGVYETPEGAIQAADKWALAVYTKLEKGDEDQEGESSSPDESPK
jgi:hypothetical protein